jgi:hypothetical protein
MLFVGAISTSCVSAGQSEAACIGPMIEAEPARGAPGEAFLVRGKAFGNGCDDVGPVLDGSEPLQDVRIVFRQGSREWLLATVDADRRLSFDVRVRVPVDTESGRATVSAGEFSSERFVVLGF